MKRQPAVAGQFYPSDREALRREMLRYAPAAGEKTTALGVLCPHAGYAFSGRVAGEVLGGVALPPVAVILCPGHNFFTPALALWSGRAWSTPLGDAAVHAELNAALSGMEYITVDNRPHAPEHSAEVVLPFLLYHRPDIQIVVQCVAASASDALVLELGRGIASCLHATGQDDALVVASSDMSHERGRDALATVLRNDRLALEPMTGLRPQALLRAGTEHGITMCGIRAAAAMMQSVIERGGTHGELVRQATSADTPLGRGDYVVGYAGMIFR